MVHVHLPRLIAVHSADAFSCQGILVGRGEVGAPPFFAMLIGSEHSLKHGLQHMIASLHSMVFLPFMFMMYFSFCSL